MKSPVALCLALLAFSSVIATGARATPFWGPEEIEAYNRSLTLTPAPPPESPSLPAETLLRDERSHDYGAALAREASFLATWQVTTPGADFGGIREGEHLPNIIQTDNTSEAIWVWSHYYEWTGDNRYYQNIQNAFTYSLSHPAYNEEGGSLPTTGYYRMYNSGWAVRAEQKYRDVYGDTAYKSYGDSCASYIRYHTLIQDGVFFDDHVNPPILSWAAGNLWWAGVHESRPEWTNAAYQHSIAVKGWVQTDPTLLGNETWAMSGGATIWGLLNSYFRVVPESTAVWVGRYISNMDNYSSPGQFQNAWNGWYAYGHRAVGVALADPIHLARHIALTDTLIAEDGDVDGGIPARPQDTDAMDQTWVSNYLYVFGLAEILDSQSGLAEGPHRAGRIHLADFANPVRNSLDLTVVLRDPSSLDAAVFDLAGRRVAGILRGEAPAGTTRLHWNGRTDAGGTAPAGVYWVVMRGDDAAVSKRLVLLR